ncbi:MAG: GAF domain-containing protein, partial [Thermoleophilia bacterium]|nr:GAF domain-containing protein [Thermoleophilia bacterium]
MDTVRELEYLQRLALTAAQTLDPPSLVRLVIAETTEAMGVDVCSVYLAEPGAGTLVLSATNGLSQGAVGRVRLRIGEGVTGSAAAERAPVVVDDVRSEPRFCWLAGVDQARFVSMCSVPIISASRLVGVLNVQTVVPHRFTPDEVAFMAAIAAQVAGALERSGLQARLEAQVDDLRRSEEIHRRFTDLARTGGGVRAVCAEIARQAGVPVALFDHGGGRLAPPGPDALPLRIAPGDGPGSREDGLTVLPVRAGPDALGWLAAAAGDGAREVSRRRALEHGVTILALELSRERASEEAERRLRGDVIGELLAGSPAPADADRLAAHAVRRGYPLQQDMWVLVMEPDGPSASAALDEGARAARLLCAVSEAAEALRPGSIVVERGGSLVVLVPGTATAEEAEGCALAAREAAERLTGGASFSCGVSGDPGGPGALHALLEQARLAVRVGRRLRRTGEVHPYRRLGAERLLLAVSPASGLADFVEEWLGPLRRQEARGRSAAPLVATIEALVSVSWSPRAAARRLDVHVNTLLYRLQRARELTGRDLDDPDVRLAFALALRARTL